MAYDDAWERECIDQWQRWSYARWAREFHEGLGWMHPDEMLDEVGWDIFYCATVGGMHEWEAARLAMDGTYRQRLRVRDDMFRRRGVALRARYRELHPEGAGEEVFETQAPDQLEFWRARLTGAEYVYFIQSGEHGPVKIGLSNTPERRLRQLQTGNPRELVLRHVIPGDRVTESRLHTRFEPARIRGEWFGREYLPVIVAFAGGLADEMIHHYDGRGKPPALAGAEVRSDTEILRIRATIERLCAAGFGVDAIAEYGWLDVDEVVDHLIAMSDSTFYDVRGDAINDLRVLLREE